MILLWLECEARPTQVVERMETALSCASASHYPQRWAETSRSSGRHGGAQPERCTGRLTPPVSFYPVRPVKGCRPRGHICEASGREDSQQASFSRFLLYTLQPQVQALREAHRVLKAGGVLLARTLEVEPSVLGVQGSARFAP